MKQCKICDKEIPQSRIKAFPKRNLVTCSQDCSKRLQTIRNYLRRTLLKNKKEGHD